MDSASSNGRPDTPILPTADVNEHYVMHQFLIVSILLNQQRALEEAEDLSTRGVDVLVPRVNYRDVRRQKIPNLGGEEKLVASNTRDFVTKINIYTSYLTQAYCVA